ncbi:isoforms C/SIF type 2, Protein still life [Lucilia cuprina]|nr:isoforms C/SIF type 2, Protein still life [Lucilia cuprina]
MGNKESVDAAAKLNAENWGHERGSRYHGYRHNQRSQSLNRAQSSSGCTSCAMGNKLSCSCAPLMRKGYRYEDSPWQSSRRRDGHLLSSFRLWAEVFHVSASGAGTVKWQQVSEDLVPVNISCIQDSPECVFHITAYNSQVDKILDVRLVQPGTRIGQASECFVYWKDPMTNDTWGLNFTSPIDAKQFRECCASSSYSLKLDPPGKGKVKAKRKPLSTPASPSRVRSEPQCTCMTAEQYARLRNDPRVRGSSTLPRNVGSRVAADADGQAHQKVTNATSSTSLYDNVASGGGGNQGLGSAGDTLEVGRQIKTQDAAAATNGGVCGGAGGAANAVGVTSGDICSQNHVGSQAGPEDALGGQSDVDMAKSEGTQAGGPLHQSVGTSTKSTGTRSKEYADDMTRDPHGHDMHQHQHQHQHQHNIINNNTRRKTKSTEDMNVDTSTLKRMLKPMTSTESPVTSPEMGRRRYNYYNANAANTFGPQHMHQHAGGGGGMAGMHHIMNNNNTLGGGRPSSQSSRFSGSRSSHEIGRGYTPRNLYLELERERGCIEGSPPSDNVMFDNQCYATTPSSSNGNSDQDQSSYVQRPPGGGGGGGGRHQHRHQGPNVTPTPGSPTSRLLLEYEMHLRNTLAKGMDAESYSLHTFEALLSQSMENLATSAKSSTLPLPPHRPLSAVRDKERDRERDGYYSDRNELVRERERERERERGYLSDHNTSFSNSRCASCIGESARAQWFRHSDGWRSGSSTIGSGSGQGLMSQQTTSSGNKRSPWDSLPSLRQDSSLNDSGYKSARADSLEQRAEFIRQDSLRSDYLSDRDSRYGIVQQASIESTDSRMCYLTSSEKNFKGKKIQLKKNVKPSQNSESDNNNSVSGSGCDKKTFSLHCCCVIVDITPVSQAGRLTSATTASGRDVTAGGGGASSGGSVLGDGVTQLANTLFRFGSKKRPVCICNAQCRLQPFGEGTLGPTIKTHHGSLDRLLQQQQQEELQQKLYPATSSARTIGGVVGEGGKGALLMSAESDDDVVDDDKDSKAPPPLPPPRPPSRSKLNVHQVKEEFDKGVEVEKFYHQINGDIFEITRRVRARNEDTIEQKLIKCRDPKRLPSQAPPKKDPSAATHIHTHSHKHHHRHAEEQKPQLPPRRQKSAEEVPVSKDCKRSPDELEWFDRKAQQRHSSRSAESGTVREETMEWLERQRVPARTSSGPSEITVMKDELPEWLLEHLPRKRSVAERQHTPQQAETRPSTSSYAKALKEELTELLKKPLSRQSSGPGEISLLKTDLVEWLTKSTKALTAREEASAKTRRPHHRRNGSGDTPRSHSHEDDVSQHPARKRHSLGYSDRSEESIPDWIAYPLNRLQSIGKTPVDRRSSHQSFVELPQKSSTPSVQPQSQTQHQTQPSAQQICSDRRYQEQRIRDRRLRHSASEVVTVSTPTPATATNVERLYAKPHKERYQYVPKDELMPPQLPPKTSKTSTQQQGQRESKRDRSRRHQTQRSATISDMTASHNGVLKRKSSSAERAPRSPSPCTDPSCPLLPICTDPNCRFLECQSTSQRKMPSSSSTLNLLRNQQLTKAQMHTVPPSDDGSAPPPPSSKVPPAQNQQKRKFVICHDCRYCAPLSCRNRKCLNAPKCNSLPRCAADFNRLRTTLAQPPALLYDIEPAAPVLSLLSSTKRADQRSNSQPNTLQRGESCALLCTGPVVAKRKHQNGHANGTNGKLTKSASAASLDERRRRHKTVHFGENLLREVCQNRKLIKYEQKPSGSQPSQTNGELLYNFVEGVLSAWHDDEDDDQLRSGAESEPEHGTVALKPLHRYDVIRYQVIKRVVNEAAELHGTLHLGNSRFRHRHWRSTAKQCNEMFLRKISDDDRMSLTTAVSDEDDGESVMASPYKAKATGTAASSFNCTGAVRKAGFLSVKKWLLRKKHQIELARKRGWKGYWVCLKGTTLLFYPCDSREGRSVEAAPKHLIIVDGAIMQPIPEHPKRDYIFCLSTAFGDAYLFQAPCQVELENWVNSIHSACAAAFARHRGKTGTLHLLQEEIFRIEKAIESDHKLKHMAELQQSVVTDQDTRLQIQGQILQWEENLERLHCEQFRLRCYMASLQSGELPNPKSLLTHVSRPTKNTLNKLGVFTVSSFHAFICARSPSLLNNLLAGRGATKRRPPMLSRSNSGSSRRSMQYQESNKQFDRNSYFGVHCAQWLEIWTNSISLSATYCLYLVLT